MRGVKYDVRVYHAATVPGHPQGPDLVRHAADGVYLQRQARVLAEHRFGVEGA